jgi:hypothetical protein
MKTTTYRDTEADTEGVFNPPLSVSYLFFLIGVPKDTARANG